MRPTLLWLCLLTLPAIPWSADAQALSAKGPVIQVSPGIIDLGTMPQEGIRHSQAVITNTGTDSLRIAEIKSECGCTVPDVPKRVLAPGDTTLLKITFRSKHYKGSLLKRVTIISNDPASPQTPVKVKVNVLQLLQVKPELTHFGNVLRGTTPSRTITFKAAREDSLVIEDVPLSEEMFTYRLDPIDEPDSTGFNLVVTLKPDAPIGHITARPGITNNLTKLPWTVYFKGVIHGFFKIKPATVSLGRFKSGVIKTATIQLEAAAEGQHRLLNATASIDQIGVQWKTIEEGRIYEVTLTTGPDLPDGPMREELRIETDDPAQPEILIPVRGSVKAARTDSD